MRLGRRGAVVAILGRSEDKAKLVAAEVEAAGGTQWTAIVDIADMTAVSEVVAQFAAKFGGIDTVVSSAGIASTGTLTSTEPDEWHRIIDTNLNGTYYLARACMPELVKTKGSFVAISSDAGVQGAQGYGRHDVLDALAAMLERSDAGAYQDRGLPFFDMHAKLWLLIAMARIGVDRPELIAPHREALKAIATNRIFPHVLMRHFAIAALRAGLPALPAAETALLDTLNRPTLPSAQWSEHRANHYGGRPEANPELSDMFRFDYDFGADIDRVTWIT